MAWSRREIEEEILEKSIDLLAFTQARDLIRRRVADVADSACQLTPLPHWSGTDAVLGSLDLAIHAMERTLGELKAMLAEQPEEPRLRLVTEEDHERES